MAKAASVWGIEIGQSALKALRCHVEGENVVTDAFDYIEYPKILSQPEADPEELINEALLKFLERNEYTRDTKIVMSVPGSSGLAKFFKPPPVELKKVADIVRYEAKQQIPFDLDDVVWDYQMMPGSIVEEGFALDSEVGLFAMKREQAFRVLEPFEKVGLEVDLIQMTPLALYNMLAYDRLAERLENETFDPDNPPSSTVLLSIGTDSSDLIITNGFRIWQRSIPLGGNHFTRQLTKDLKLTFAKAEHLKRHAREAEDPKLIFQTMRPIFNDMVTEVQRSIGFFRSINKKAEIAELLVSGNTVKMPGLAQYLGKNLGYEVHAVDRFTRLEGEDVLTVPAFRDNATTFGVCYGLALQGLGQGQLKTSMVPQEILTERMIRAKKPWALACVAALLLGLATHYVFVEKSWSQTHPDDWGKATSAVKQTSEYSSRHKGEFDGYKSKLVYLQSVGNEVSGNSERRLQWMELASTIVQMLPRGDYPDGIPSPKEVPYVDRPDVFVQTVDSRFYEDLSVWFDTRRSARYIEELRSWADLTGSELAEGYAEDTGPAETGWVIEVKGYHYYNSTKRKGFEASNHLRRTLLNNFLTKSVQLPDENGEMHTFTMEEMGISYPILVSDNKPTETMIPNPDYEPPPPGTLGMGDGMGMEGGMGMGMGMGMAPGMPAVDSDDPNAPKFEPRSLKVVRQDFTFQFVWKPLSFSERLQMQKEAAEKAALEAEEAAEQMVEGQEVAMLP
ncbi:Competence protein A [Roseimaritima multifibrata]|uniref:Competence protein A n=1 Tax=Roseimaritima multifibrata TaxID=1930274 RepID=A0A517MCH7_9BACT|nr:type IV pilus assembly protein PilM [Roseimaritima multifibrata]QDS92598.1 Competence protein A [Roseimaritima multifibrata]